MAWLGCHGYLYMETSCMTHKIKLITHLYLSHMERHPKILETLSAKPFQQRKIPTLKGFQFTIYHYISTRPSLSSGTLELSDYRVLRDFSFANLTFRRFLVSITSMPSVWSICSYPTGTHWSDLEPTTHWWFNTSSCSITLNAKAMMWLHSSKPYIK